MLVETCILFADNILLLQAIFQKSSATMMSEEYSLCAAAKHQQVQIACFSRDKDQSVCKMYTLIAHIDFRVTTGQRKAALEVKDKPAWSGFLSAYALPQTAGDQLQLAKSFVGLLHHLSTSIKVLCSQQMQRLSHELCS